MDFITIFMFVGVVYMFLNNYRLRKLEEYAHALEDEIKYTQAHIKN